MKRSHSLPLRLALGLASALVVSPAAAAPDFPGVIQKHLGLDYAPPCEMCHENGNAGVGTIRTPVGFTVRQYGVDPDVNDTMVAALDQMKANAVDSDGDGKTDVDELTGKPASGTTAAIPPSNPNVRAPGDVPWPPPLYPETGCASIAGSHAGLAPLAAAGLIAGFFALRRRRSRGRAT